MSCRNCHYRSVPIPFSIPTPLRRLANTYNVLTCAKGRPHCGYFVPALKIGQYLAAGCHVIVLLADIHAFLDNLKSSVELVQARAQYYQWTITEILKAVGVPIEKLEFVMGSSYQKTPE